MPVPALSIVSQTENPGMAKNVERNIKSIFDHCDIVTNSGWEQVTKTRYMHLDTNHMFIRVDTDHTIPRIEAKNLPLERYDIIAVSDYNKGFLIKEDVEYICEHHNNVFIDTKKVLGDWANKAKYVKINNFEYECSKDFITPILYEKLICTKGKKGAVFRGKTYPTPEEIEIKDTSGAGDVFFAALIVRYAETGDIEKAIRFANRCASRSVQRKGVSVIERF